jgi:ferredoxin
MDDQVDLLLQAGQRGRTYDSCQFQDFAVVAGGHNFRRERADRVRHRWFRKFVYLLREHGEPFCIGCGRCSKSCTAGISLVDVLNSVLGEARKEAVR